MSDSFPSSEDTGWKLSCSHRAGLSCRETVWPWAESEPTLLWSEPPVLLKRNRSLGTGLSCPGSLEGLWQSLHQPERAPKPGRHTHACPKAEWRSAHLVADTHFCSLPGIPVTPLCLPDQKACVLTRAADRRGRPSWGPGAGTALATWWALGKHLLTERVTRKQRSARHPGRPGDGWQQGQRRWEAEPGLLSRAS